MLKRIVSHASRKAGLLAIALAFCAAAPGRSEAEEKKYRDFYVTLEDVLGDFEYDLKNGNVTGLKDLSIRNIAMSEKVPPSFRNHLELAITERIMKHTKGRLIQCLPCRAKRTTVDGDNVVITSAQTNPVELARIAKMSNIQNFMDVAFTYEPSGMVLSMYIVEPESGAVVWSRSYNSETSRAAAFRRGVDYSQIDEARRHNEYMPTLQHHLTFYYMFQRNVSGYTGCLGLGFRVMERYDNRKKEVGFEANYFRDVSTLIGPAPDESEANIWGGLNITLMFVHAWNLIGNEENFNRARSSVSIGLGGTYASGYLGALVRANYEWRLGKHWAISGNVGYRPKATAFLGEEEAGVVSGAEFGMGVSWVF